MAAISGGTVFPPMMGAVVVSIGPVLVPRVEALR